MREAQKLQLQVFTDFLDCHIFPLYNSGYCRRLCLVGRNYISCTGGKTVKWNKMITHQVISLMV